jgi:hypothetical protein
MHILSCHHVYLFALCDILVVVRVTCDYLYYILFLVTCCCSYVVLPRFTPIHMSLYFLYSRLFHIFEYLLPLGLYKHA